MNSLKVPCIAEKAVIFLFSEENLISEDLVKKLTAELSLDREYLVKSLSDNRRSICLD